MDGWFSPGRMTSSIYVLILDDMITWRQMWPWIMVHVHPDWIWSFLILTIFLSFRGENGQLRVGVRRASKQQPLARSTYFSCVNLHLGVLAAASHAAKEMLRFSVIYNPRLVWCTCPMWCASCTDFSSSRAFGVWYICTKNWCLAVVPIWGYIKSFFILIIQFVRFVQA